MPSRVTTALGRDPDRRAPVDTDNEKCPTPRAVSFAVPSRMGTRRVRGGTRDHGAVFAMGTLSAA